MTTPIRAALHGERHALLNAQAETVVCEHATPVACALHSQCHALLRTQARSVECNTAAQFGADALWAGGDATHTAKTTDAIQRPYTCRPFAFKVRQPLPKAARCQPARCQPARSE